MKPLIWAAVAGGVIVSILFATRKSAAVQMQPLPSPSNPTKDYGESEQVTLPVPSGWRRVTSAEVTPELTTQANALRNASGFTSMRYGTLAPFTASDGKTYATWIEQHYHEPGGPTKPWGLHHGVTLLVQTGALGVLLDEWWGLR